MSIIKHKVEILTGSSNRIQVENKLNSMKINFSCYKFTGNGDSFIFNCTYADYLILSQQPKLNSINILKYDVNISGSQIIN